ncbi:MAG: MATE family efflux transporter [Pseudomonadota bacterium]
MAIAAIPADETVGAKILRHTADLLRLAWPVMLSRAGILIMAFADIAMLGRYGDGAVGISNLAIAIFVPVIVMTIGMASGMVPDVSQAYGAGHREECGRAFRRALSWGVFCSLIGMAVVWRGETLLGWFGQTPELAQAGGTVSVALAPGVLAQTLFAVCAFYLESTRRPMFALTVMIAANVINVILNWLLIFGNLGFPELGAVGAAIASTIARFGAAGLMLWYVFTLDRAPALGVRGPWETMWGPGGWRLGWPMRKLGGSAAISNGFETIGFAAMSLMAGTLGIAALDAYSISHNLVSTFFMIGLGLAVATGVRVGQATGAGDPREAAFAGWTGLLVALLIMGSLASLVLLFRTEIAHIYTNDPELAARAATVFLFAAFVCMPDSLQVVMGQAIRALGDAWVPLAAYAASFVVLMIPFGWYLTRALGWDERGLVLAVVVACVLATVLLAWRFRALTKVRG